MKRPGLQSKSKRTSVRLREKVKKKVRDHNRKQRKFDRENAKTKKQHVPNSAPFKDEILMDAIKFQEAKRAKVAERKERRKIKKGKAKAETIASLMKDVASAQSTYNKKQATKDQVKAEAYEHDKKKAAWFRRELKYVTSNADVILEVLDARDPIGCRSEQLESQAFAAGKRVVLVLNKVDLVPKPIVKGWLEVLRKQLPTVAFKASTQKQRTNLGRGQSASGATAYGADQLTKMLGAFAKTKGMKTGVTAAVVGFPNVGKSSIINTLARSRVCNVSATAGSTKDTQEVSIDKAVKLLDSPGVLFGGSAEKQALRGALSASALADPVEGALALLNRCDKVALALHYSTNHTDNGRSFLAQLAQKRGLVKKGGIPDCEKSARQILQDCQRGRFSFYTKPPKTATAEELTVPEFLDAKLVTTMSEEFKLDGLDDWMETSDISAPTSGKGIGLSNDGFGELEDSEDEEEEEGQSGEENEEMEEDDKMEEDVAVDFPEKKTVKFGGVSDKKVATDLRQRQKADKKILKRKDKFETKLSESVEKALKLIMAKKGKGKGKGSGKGKGGGGKTGNARTDFLAVRINLREKALMMVEHQCADYQNTLEKLEEARDEAQAEKDAKVGKLLKKLHVSENERSGALDNLKDRVNERKKKLRDANNRRKREIEEKLGCLREAELRNAQIRRDIKKWQNFRTLGSLDQKAAVESLLSKIEDQSYNTKAMNHFIVKQIETSKSDSKKNKHDLEEGRKKQAVADAIECMPTSVHECRKTDQLKKLVDWQQLHVDEDKQYLKDIRHNMKLMTKETEELRKIKFEKPEKIGLLLDKRFFS